MYDLLMQIEINEKQSNRKICYDDIVSIRVKNNILFIKDDIGFKTNFDISNDIEIKIYFDKIIPF